MTYFIFLVNRFFFSFYKNIPFLSFNKIFFTVHGIWNIPIIFLNNQLFKNFGIWNIPKKRITRKILKSVEYGIFEEYSKKTVKHSKYPKFWNMEYSMEYSWNIPKNVKQAMGA